FRVAFLRYTIADERRPRRAQSKQFVRIDWNVSGVLAAEVGVLGSVLQKIAGHPMVFARTRQVFDGFTPVAPMQLRSALAGRTDENDGKSHVIRHRDASCLAVARHAFDADAFRVDGLVGLHIVETARSAPCPCAQGAPVVGFSRLTLIDESDNAS